VIGSFFFLVHTNPSWPFVLFDGIQVDRSVASVFKMSVERCGPLRAERISDTLK